MGGVLVKICGLRSGTDLEVAAEAGADFVGFVFAPSRRRVTPEEVRTMADHFNGRSRPRLVGVFVNPDPDELNDIVEFCRLDRVQLSGNEPPELCRLVRVPAWKTIHLAGPDSMEAAARYAGVVEFIHLDAFVPGQFGGTGVSPDWTLAAELARTWPVILAGGLTPDNVAAAVSLVRPAGVDVSSGVETGGQKDPAKVRAFVRQARRAAAVLKQ